MDTAVVYEHLESLLSLQEGVLKGSDELDGYARWDSLTVLEYMELVDNWGRQLRPAQIMGCRTVDDLVQLTVQAVAVHET
jgi:acyl carrier protein